MKIFFDMDRPFVSGLLSGAVLTVFIITLTFLTGQTFGQRCTAMGFEDDAWHQCVSDLADGRDPRERTFTPSDDQCQVKEIP